MAVQALLLTILVGCFFLIGFYLPKFFKNKNSLVLYTTGISFVVMLFLLLFDILPEIIEILKEIHKLSIFFLFLGIIVLGVGTLKLIDIFVPEHHHNHQQKEDNLIEHNNHLFHIGFITAISLITHNILEGISIYITGINNIHLGLLMAFTVGLHNFPLGMEISISLDATKKGKSYKLILLGLLIFSSFLGAFLLFIFNKELSNLIEGLFLSLTFGMLIYINFLELWPEIKTSYKEREIKKGLIIGILLVLLLFLI